MTESHEHYSDLHQDLKRAEGYAGLFADDGTYESWLWHSIELPMLHRRFRELAKGGAMNLLDVACGPGRVACTAGEHFAHVEGIDISAAMVKIARSQCTRDEVTFSQADLTSYERTRTWDVVTAWRLLLNADSQLRSDFFRTARSLVAKDGLVIVNVHVNAGSPVAWAYALLDRLPLKRRAHPLRNRLSVADVERLAETCDLEVVEVIYYGYWPRLRARMPSGFARIAALVERFGKTAARRHAQHFLMELRPVSESAARQRTRRV